LSPPLAAASLAALRVMLAEPERVVRLNANSQAFMAAAQAAGLNTGTTIGAAIVPVIVGSSIAASRAAERLFQRGVNVQPILYPAVPERGARLRFFLSSEHTTAQIEQAVNETALAVREAKADKVPFSMLLKQFGSHPV
jgi:8-amino-7-oxononanoate synthase